MTIRWLVCDRYELGHVQMITAPFCKTADLKTGRRDPGHEKNDTKDNSKEIHHRI